MKRTADRIRIDKRKAAASLLLGAFFAGSSVLGKAIESTEEMVIDLWHCIGLCGIILGISVFLYGSWTLIERAAGKRRKEARLHKKHPLLYSFWGRAMVIFVMWLPCFLAVFPGAFSYDAFEQWRQVKEWDLSTIHPVLHTLLVGGCVEGGFQLFGSYNVGIFCYTVLQMAVLAIIFSAGIAFLEYFQVSPTVRLAALFYWGGAPVIQIFAVCTTKDIYFSGAMFLFLMCLVCYECKKDCFFQSKRQKLLFVCSAFGVAVLRNNGLYIILIVLLMLLFLERKKKENRRLMPLAAVTGILCVFYLGPVYSILGVEQGGGRRYAVCPAAATDTGLSVS